MLIKSLLIVSVSISTVSASAGHGLFTSQVVKILDRQSFERVMERNETSLVAFVCTTHDQMGREFEKAALGLYPLIPAYAVDCDDAENTRLCSDQDVIGFLPTPTIKLFPRGKSSQPLVFDGEMPPSGSELYYYATRRIPNGPTKLYTVDQMNKWIYRTSTGPRPRALLLTKEKKAPLLWKVLSNKYAGQVEFGSHRDRKGRSSVGMGMEPGEKGHSKVLIYSPGEKVGVRYTGLNRLENLSKFLDSIIDDPNILIEEQRTEQEVLTAEEEEIARKQEAQRLALLHGGFSHLIDFEEALKNGGMDFHGHGGGFGDLAKKRLVEDATLLKDEL